MLGASKCFQSIGATSKSGSVGCSLKWNFLAKFEATSGLMWISPKREHSYGESRCFWYRSFSTHEFPLFVCLPSGHPIAFCMITHGVWWFCPKKRQLLWTILQPLWVFRKLELSWVILGLLPEDTSQFYGAFSPSSRSGVLVGPGSISSPSRNECRRWISPVSRRSPCLCRRMRRRSLFFGGFFF